MSDAERELPVKGKRKSSNYSFQVCASASEGIFKGSGNYFSIRLKLK